MTIAAVIDASHAMETFYLATTLTRQELEIL